MRFSDAVDGYNAISLVSMASGFLLQRQGGEKWEQVSPKENRWVNTYVVLA